VGSYTIYPSQCITSLQNALKYFIPAHIFVRDWSTRGGKVLLSESLEGKKLTFKEIKMGLLFFIDGKNVFLFESVGKKWHKEWSVEYEHEQLINGKRVLMHHNNNENPNDPNFPEPKRTILRSGNGLHLIEMTFDGKIPIKQILIKGKQTAWFVPMPSIKEG